MLVALFFSFHAAQCKFCFSSNCKPDPVLCIVPPIGWANTATLELNIFPCICPVIILYSINFYACIGILTFSASFHCYSGAWHWILVGTYPKCQNCIVSVTECNHTNNNFIMILLLPHRCFVMDSASPNVLLPYSYQAAGHIERLPRCWYPSITLHAKTTIS